MANINDIAKITGYAKSTVSNVFTKKRYVSREIIDNVMRACKELNYTPNYFASNILENNTNIIGLFLEAGNSNYYSFYNTLIQSLVVNSSKHKKQLLVYFNQMEEDLANSLRSGRSPISGAVILSPSIIDKRITDIESANIPYVVIGHTNDPKYAPCLVDIDNVKVMHLVINHLYSRGHRRVLFFNSKATLTVSKDRDIGVSRMMKAYGDLSVFTYHVPNRRGAVKAFLDAGLKKGGTAVVCASDILANDIYVFAREYGLTVGKDISVISLGGDVYAESLIPALTRCNQDYDRIGRECINLLVKRMADKDYRGERILSSGLFIGDSVADLR